MSSMRALLIALTAVLLFPVGCKDDDSPTGTGTDAVPAALVGTWTFDSLTVGGLPADPALIFGWPSEVGTATIKVESNGAFTISGSNADAQVIFTSQGSISVTGSNFTVTVVS